MNQSGTAYFERGQYAWARGDFERAVADQPDNADYIHNLAAAMKKQGDLVGAEQTYRRALTIDPSHQPSYHSLAQLYIESGRQGEALALAQEWADIEPYKAEPFVELAFVQRELGDTAGSEQSLRSALQANPRHPKALAHLGQVYQDSGRTDQAAALYQHSLAQQWYQPEVQSRLVTLQGSGSYATSTTTAYGPTSGTTTAYQSTPWLSTNAPVTTYAAPTYSNSPTTAYAAPLYAPAYPTATYPGQPVPMYANAPQPVQISTPIYGAPPPTVMSGVPVVQPY
ncbi:MAG: tetratricopeptide repeat protein [Planctomycetota bacterium]|nr:tetratricopeptide repeat protein [Planctomycetota bacterium]MDA1211290.1 tetratricopeptide repeat protein [Planctomycetota bacterium]